MGEKRFRTRIQWNNTRLAFYAAPVLLLIGIFVGVVPGRFHLFIILAGIALAGFIVAIFRDRTTRGSYLITNDALVLARGRERMVIPADDIIDASLLDRAASRDYFRSRSAKQGMSNREARRIFLRFCTVDIGLRTFTFGLGRGLIDRMPNARQDMLLLRVRQGADLLLSPEYNQDMVESIARLLRRHKDGTVARP